MFLNNINNLHSGVLPVASTSQITWRGRIIHHVNLAFNKIIDLIQLIIQFLFCTKPEAKAIIIESVLVKTDPVEIQKEESEEEAAVDLIDYKEDLPPSPSPLPKRVLQTTTAALLTSGEFARDACDEFVYSPKHPFYVGEMQGNSAMRKGAKKWTAEDPHVISPKSLSANKEAHLRNYLILQIKRFTHALHITGTGTLPDETKIDFEGFDEAFTAPMLASSYDKFASRHPDEKVRREKDYLVKTFNQMTLSDSLSPAEIKNKLNEIRSPNFVGPAVFGSGYDWHFKGVIFFHDMIFVCDPNDKIKVYTYNRNQLSLAWFTKLLKRHEHSKLHNEFTPFKPIYEHSTKFQKNGHCTYTGAKRLFYTLMAIRQLDMPSEHPSIQQLVQMLKRSFETAKPVYKEWTVFERRLVINDLVVSIKKITRKKNLGPLDVQICKLYYSVLDGYQSQNSQKVSNRSNHKLTLAFKQIEKIVSDAKLTNS